VLLGYKDLRTPQQLSDKIDQTRRLADFATDETTRQRLFELLIELEHELATHPQHCSPCVVENAVR
jgi:hypothetical protein